MMKKIRIFGHLNHLAHNHTLLKLAEKYPVEFTYLENNVRRWSRTSHRQPPDYLNWATYYEPGKYDLAILHLDQQAVDPEIGKGWIYRNLDEVIQDIPKIVINHGTPMWDERYDEEMVINGGTTYDSKGKPHQFDGMKKMIGDNFMVVNSYEAVDRWGWGYPIIHGMDPNEWPVEPKEPRVCISLSPGGLDKYYNRSLVTAIKAKVQELVGHDLTHFNINYMPLDGEDYKYFFSSCLIHVYPFKDSPMPRARSEAMMCGSCVLTSRYHGGEDLIKNGENGFVIPDNPLDYAEVINQLINYNYKEAVEMGVKARETAIKYFDMTRYLDQWWELINHIIEGKKPIWNKEKLW